MATQSDLAKIGEDGFRIIDTFWGKTSKNHHIPPSQPIRTYQVNTKQLPNCHLRYQPHDSYVCYPPPAAQTARVTKVYATEAAVVNSYRNYEAASKFSEDKLSMEYQRQIFRMP